MASHLASMSKVGPTIGERLSSETKAALDEQKRGEMRLLIRCFWPPRQAAANHRALEGKPRASRFSLSLSPTSTSSRRRLPQSSLPEMQKTPSPPPQLNSTRQRPSSASPGSASSPSPGCSTTARASRSRRSRPTGSCRRRSGCGRWSARGRPGPRWCATL